MGAHGMGNLHVYEGTINAEWNMQVWGNMCCQVDVLFQEISLLFQQYNTKPNAASIITTWLSSERVRVLNWPACRPDLSPIERFGRIQQKKQLTLGQRKFYNKTDNTGKIVSKNHLKSQED